MRFYSFTNSYIHAKQHAIQAGHAIEQVWLKVMTGTRRSSKQYLIEYATNHKTWYVMDGGGPLLNWEIIDAYSTYSCFPSAYFREPGLENAMTAMAVLLPERMYDKAASAYGRYLKGTDPVFPSQYADVIEAREYSQEEEAMLIYMSGKQRAM